MNCDHFFIFIILQNVKLSHMRLQILPTDRIKHKQTDMIGHLAIEIQTFVGKGMA